MYQCKIEIHLKVTENPQKSLPENDLSEKKFVEKYGADNEKIVIIVSLVHYSQIILQSFISPELEEVF